ncbi:WD40 repeat-like protein [Periconia macrospinosa]|uniref:WD40 repeat-like protein n=1 Tax=Periconia macrospinosa TaxID=97972 RepID=A0A2V1EDP0_9PLEO|nr:WD40 repeat-like protein [Periconia macrospinosa]
MASPQQLRGRYAHAPGPTFLAYTPDGKKLVTAGVDNFCRIFNSGSDEEPTNVDDCEENNAAIVAGNTFFVIAGENGNISRYSLESHKFEYYLERVSLPARDVALSPDQNWVAVASEEHTVLLVNTGGRHERQVKKLSDHQGSVKHVSFDPTGQRLAVSSTDGFVYIYTLDATEPRIIKKLDGLIKRHDLESSSEVLWHPDGRAFAVPTPLREIQVVSINDWEKQQSFKTPHSADITAAAWSPNGSFLVTTASDLKLCLWDTKTLKLVKTYDDVKATITAMEWHPTENILSYTSDGLLYIHNEFVPAEYADALQKPLQPAPFFHDPAENRLNIAPSKLVDGATHRLPERRQRQVSLDPLDDILGSDFQDEEMDDFVEDDDGAGYAPVVNGHGKRTNGHLDSLQSRSKRPAHTSNILLPEIHEPFQPGATPWRGNRRMLCCSLFGYVSTISQEGENHTVELKFSDKRYRDAKISDIYGYDKAALSTKGALLSCQPGDGHSAMIYYRPHGAWTSAPEDWRTNLPVGESVTSIALSESYAVVTTSSNLVRIYSLFGLPIRVYRQKSSPAVTCAAWRDYVLTVGNGPVGADGTSQLLYTIENVKRDEIYQSEDIVALAPNTKLVSVFFSTDGDPYIYDSDGVLLTLLRWRTTGQARWVPMLDTRNLSRRVGGGKEETYWPVGVQTDEDNNRVFECYIIKGSERYPSNPPPLSSQFPLEIPISSSTEESSPNELEQDFVLSSILHTQLAETLSHTRPTEDQEAALSALEARADAALLRMLPPECRTEKRNPKALELVELMRDSNDRFVKGALKAAERFAENPELVKKMRRVQAKKERARLAGGDAVYVDYEDDADDDIDEEF